MDAIVGMVGRNGMRIPAIIDLLRDLLKCRRAGFTPGHPIRQALRHLIVIEEPFLKARIDERKRVRLEKERKPIQLRLF